MIYRDFNEIADRFDTLLVDAYGVFWDGTKAIPNSLETLSSQVRLGKRVCILSNTTLFGKSAIDNYTRKGVIKGIHYTDVATSGDVFYDCLIHNHLPFPGNRICTFGIIRWSLDVGEHISVVTKPEDADIVFFGTPQLTEEQIVQSPALREITFPVRGDSNRFDVSTVQPFENGLKHLFSLGLPAISTNPDQIVLENGHWVIRQGALAKAYRDMGGRIVEYGKPYHNIYEYTFNKLRIKPSERVAMIGDTFRTDIRGALDNGITPIWCLDYGVAKYEADHGVSLEQQSGGRLDGILLIHHL